MKYRPFLKVLVPPKVIDYELTSEGLSEKDFLQIGDQDSILDIHSTLGLTIKFAVVNEGNALAQLYALIKFDTGSGEDVARRSLLSGDASKFTFLRNSAYFNIDNIPPNDTAYFTEHFTVRFPDSGVFTAHYLILYENELGQLFDTYHWARFAAKEVLMRPEFRILDGILQVRFISDKGQFRDFISYKDGKENYFIYQESESGDVRDMIAGSALRKNR